MGNHAATDRNWFYLNQDGSPRPGGDGQFPDVEWDFSRTENYPVVATRGSSVTLEIQFFNPQFVFQSGTWTVAGARLRIPGVPSDTLVPLTVTSGGTVNIAPFSFGSINVTVSGLPNYVALGTLEIDAKVEGDELLWNTGGYAPWDQFYITYQTPVEHQEVPWTEMLGYSCLWALGESSLADVCEEETYGLYWGDVFAYNLGTEVVPPNWVETRLTDPNYLKFKLKKLHEDLFTSGTQAANCVDVSDFLHLILASQGVDSQLQQLFHVTGNPPEIKAYITQKACPIGSDGSQSGLYFQFKFTMHQQAIPSSGVCDAALAYECDRSGNLFMNPAANWTMTSYWQSGSSPNVWGHAYRDYRDSDGIYTPIPPLPPWNVVNVNPLIPATLIDHEPDTYDLPGVF